MTQMAEFWVGIAFVVFVLILLYYKVPGLIAKSLDDRADAIRKELDEARRLREEAQNLLTDYQKRHRNVGQEADAILDLARREAEAFAREARVALKDTLAAHAAGRGQDRACRDAGGRRGAGCGHRGCAGGGGEDHAREDGRLRRRPAHRPEHQRPKGPAELTVLSRSA